MMHVQGEDTTTPTVDYTTGLATVTCGDCSTTKSSFKLSTIAMNRGNYFSVDSKPFGCGCKYVTVYDVNGKEPIVAILLKALS